MSGMWDCAERLSRASGTGKARGGLGIMTRRVGTPVCRKEAGGGGPEQRERLGLLGAKACPYDP